VKVFVDGINVAIAQSGKYSGQLLLEKGFFDRCWRGSMLYFRISAGERYTTNVVPTASCSRDSGTIYYLSDEGQ
jgi:hypothetical protein